MFAMERGTDNEMKSTPNASFALSDVADQCDYEKCLQRSWEHASVDRFSEENSWDLTHDQYLGTNDLSFCDPFSTPTSEERIAFSHMLEDVQSPSISPSPEPNNHFQLRLQQQEEKGYDSDIDSRTLPLEQEPFSAQSCKEARNFSSTSTRLPDKQTHQQKNKRKRGRACKNGEEAERQRMIHIAVERNRRKQMNIQLAALRSLLPPSFIRRGDQASIIGGAIDFVKELERQLQTLEARKQTQETGEEEQRPHSQSLFNTFYQSSTPSQQSHSTCDVDEHLNDEEGQCPEFTIKKKIRVADIEVTVVQSHENLKIV